MNWQQLSFNAKSFRSREQRRGEGRFALAAASSEHPEVEQNSNGCFMQRM